MENSATQKSVIETYAAPQSQDYAREIERGAVEQSMARKTQQFQNDREAIESFKERLNNQAASRTADVEPLYRADANGQFSSVVQEYARENAAANDQGKEAIQVQGEEEVNERNRAQEKEQTSADKHKSSVVDKYGASVEEAEKARERKVQAMKDQSPAIAY